MAGSPDGQISILAWTGFEEVFDLVLPIKSYWKRPI
jgi:hypothetical protein